MENTNNSIALSPRDKKLALLIILISFLTTFIVIRFVVYAALKGWVPRHPIKIKDVHVHHLCLGIALLSYVGIYALLWRPTNRQLYRTYIVYGMALSLTFDEFAMWVHLDSNYWHPLNFVAMGVLLVILLNLIFFNAFWRKLGNKIPFLGRRLID